MKNQSFELSDERADEYRQLEYDLRQPLEKKYDPMEELIGKNNSPEFIWQILDEAFKPDDMCVVLSAEDLFKIFPTPPVKDETWLNLQEQAMRKGTVILTDEEYQQIKPKGV
jgi:hypothetical protein